MKFQYELWLSRWPVIYVMMGLCAFGVLCKLISNIATRQLARQMRRVENRKRIGRRSMTRQLLGAYRKNLRKGVVVEDLDRFVQQALAAAKVLGIPIVQLENGNLTMMVLCFTLGAVNSMIAYLSGSSDSEIVFVFTAGLALTGVCVIAEVFFHNDYHRMMYLLGMQNYIENEYRFRVEAELRREEEAKLKTYQEVEAEVRARHFPDENEVRAQHFSNEEMVDGAYEEPVPYSEDMTEQEQVLTPFSYRDSTFAGIAATSQINDELLEEMLRGMLLE